MIRFKSLLEHQDTLAILYRDEVTFAGIGGTICVYHNDQFVTSSKIWTGQKIHLIKSDALNRIYVVGGKQVALCSYDCNAFNIILSFKNEDWIFDVTSQSLTDVLLLSSHNQVYCYNLLKRQLSIVKSTSEKCILYSGCFYSFNGGLYVLAGTVFSETLVWPLSEIDAGISSTIKHRIKGHKGVIFSISARNLNNKKSIICTTSDDRTAHINFWDNSSSGENIMCLSLQGHCARVWKSLMTEENIFTIGEDSLVCSWSYDGTLINKCELSHCGGIRSISLGRPNNVLIGGCDGSILNINRGVLLSSTSSRLIPLNFERAIPRKVAYSNGTIICLADQSLFEIQFHSESWTDVRCNTRKLSYKCTDLSSSNCEKYFALATACGRLIIYNSDDDNATEFEIGKGRRCEVVKRSGPSLLVQMSGGELNLFEKHNGTLIMSSSFILKRIKERSLTCFNSFNSFLLVGDRTGNLHIYSGLQTPVQTIFKLHGNQGIYDIFIKTDTVLTVGAGGKVRELGFVEGTLNLLRSFSIPMEMASKIINTSSGIVIAGFQGSYLQLWNFDQRVVLGSLKCGGGHRSYDFQLTNNNISFVYIKNKQLFQAMFPLKFCEVVRKSYHSKIINCLSAIPGYQYPILVSGSDDNTVRIVEIKENDINPIAIVEQHISSIRALRIILLSDHTYLIISTGGREQIAFTKFNLKTRSCQELLSYLPKSTIADSRFMCIEILKVSNEKLLIFLGSSDCSIRIFQFNDPLHEIGVLRYSHCILQILIVDTFVVTFGTDGKCVFWDLQEFLGAAGTLPASPIGIFTLHQSGINSVAIKQRTQNQFLLATGGDDSLLKLTILELTKFDIVEPWKVLSKWDIPGAHSCQITGLIFYENVLISTALDQRVIVHQIFEKRDDSIETKISGETMTTVPDAHGLSLISTINANVTLCIFGKGVEIIVLSNLESKEPLSVTS